MRKIIAIIGLIIMSGGVVYFMTQDEPVQDTPIKDSATQTVTTDSKIDLMPDAGFSFDLGDLGQNLFGGTASIDPAEIRVPELSGAAKDLIDGLTTATEPLQDTSLTKIIPKLEDAAADLPKIEEVVPSESSDISDIFDKAKESMETYDIFDSSF